METQRIIHLLVCYRTFIFFIFQTFNFFTSWFICYCLFSSSFSIISHELKKKIPLSFNVISMIAVSLLFQGGTGSYPIKLPELLLLAFYGQGPAPPFSCRFWEAPPNWSIKVVLGLYWTSQRWDPWMHPPFFSLLCNLFTFILLFMIFSAARLLPIIPKSNSQFLLVWGWLPLNS